MSGPVPELADRANRCADALRDADRVLLASHIDADGLTSAGVAAHALERASIPFEAFFSKQLDDAEIQRIANRDEDTVLFTDFGSGQLDAITEHEAAGDFTPVIADHHQPAEDSDTDCHLNPLLEGVDGGKELSGAGTAYVLARAMESNGTDNRDLAALAVVGAVGDMQTVDGELIGANASIVAEGVECGVVDMAKDLAVYGTQTRELPKLLQYSSDVYIPGISNDQNGAIRFLQSLDLDLRPNGAWATWADLDHAERQTLVSALVRRAVRNGVSHDDIADLIGVSYTLSREEPGTELRDASEFSTLLNATARYDREDVGLAVCLGDRDGALDSARRLLREHRRNLSQGLQWVKEEGVHQEEHVQWFHAEDRLRETIVGIVAGMSMSAEGVTRSKPILAFAYKQDEPENTKVSSRGSGKLVNRGLDLSEVMREASQAVGGDGGGHTVAAGATVPRGREDEFVAEADKRVAAQLS